MPIRLPLPVDRTSPPIKDLAHGARRQPLRIAFVMHVMQVAGAEMLVQETINRLGGRIHPVIFCLDAVGPLGERLRKEGVEVLNFGRRPGRDFGVARRMAAAIRERNIDLLHAHQYTPFFYAALARVWSRTPVRVVFTEHGRHFPDTVAPLRRAVNRLGLDHLADAVNAVCRFSARSLSRVDGFRGNRIEVIENGIHVDRYGSVVDPRTIRSRLGLAEGRHYVANVARFHPVKDQAMLLRAFQTVAAARNDVDLLLVGDGPLRGELTGQTQHLGLAGRVHFLGVRSDVPDILRAVEVFALTSVSEAASLTLLEAMASALPVVVTAVGGNPEIVRDGKEGLLVPRGDAAATAAALLRLLNYPDAARRMGAAGLRRVHERYRLEQTVERYMSLYEQVCRRGGKDS
jgi:glycosyltransferase involved in cell wall biosynthesis